MKQADQVTSGPLVHTVIWLAVPVVVGMLLEFAMHVVNLYWVGRLGAAAQDAVTSSMVIIWTIFATTSTITIGVRALVSRYVGSGETPQAAGYIRQALWFALGLATLVAIPGFIFARDLLALMGAGKESLEMAVPYMHIFFVSAYVFMIYDTIYSAFSASGDTRTPLWIGGIAIGLNMILDPLLIFGIGPFPKLGVPGASLATGISITVALSVFLWRLHSGKLGYPVDGIFRSKVNFTDILRIGRIGLPMASQQLVFVGVYWFLIDIVHRFGPSAGAAMGIGNRMEALSYLTCQGFSIAAATMVGQNLGAGNPDRAAKGAWVAAALAIGVTAINSILLLLFNQPLAAIFSPDAAVQQIAQDYMIILALSQFTMAIEIVIEGAFSGAGDTIPPMLVLLPGAIARIPLAYYLAFDCGLGVNGVWWTLTITTTIKAACIALWFRRGKWKLKKV